jgi:hypothetical protein
MARVAPTAVSVLRPFTIDHAPLPATTPTVQRLAINAAYFDACLSLIPSKYYIGPDDDEKAGGWGKYARVSGINGHPG